MNSTVGLYGAGTWVRIACLKGAHADIGMNKAVLQPAIDRPQRTKTPNAVRHDEYLTAAAIAQSVRRVFSDSRTKFHQCRTGLSKG
jgi:hypothetical protein